jgi:hypothetical protein
LNELANFPMGNHHVFNHNRGVRIDGIANDQISRPRRP